MKNHDYIPRTFKIVGRESLCPDTLGLVLKPEDNKTFEFCPGQFVMVSAPGFGEIPVGLTTSPGLKEVGIGIRSAGMVTEKLCSLMKGDKVGINGPFGNGFPLSKIKGKDVVLIAGGIGLLPLRSLIQYIGEHKKFVKSLTILVGSRCPESLIFQKEYKEWGKFANVQATVDTCDPEWDGCVGNITKLFDKVKVSRGSVMVVCGPPVMHKPIITRFAGKSISESDLCFMLERKMKCGIGKCQHCTCGKLYVCQDGPVFAYSDIKYNQEAMK